MRNSLKDNVLCGLWQIFRMRFSGRRREGVKATTAAKVSAGVAILSGVFFLVLAFVRCNAAPLDGLGDVDYTQPACSQSCGSVAHFVFLARNTSTYQSNTASH